MFYAPGIRFIYLNSINASAIHRFLPFDNEKNVLNGEEMINPDALMLVPTSKISSLKCVRERKTVWSRSFPYYCVPGQQ